MTPTESADKKLEALIAGLQGKLKYRGKFLGTEDDGYTKAVNRELSLLALIQTQREALKSVYLSLSADDKLTDQGDRINTALDASNKTIENL